MYTNEEFRIIVEVLDERNHLDRLASVVRGQSAISSVKPAKPAGASPFEKKHLAEGDIRASWQEYIEGEAIAGTDFAQKYGFSSIAPLRKRWIEIGIYDPVADYRRAKDSGLQGFPLSQLRKRVEEAGRLDELDQPTAEAAFGSNGTVVEDILQLQTVGSVNV